MRLISFHSTHSTVNLLQHDYITTTFFLLYILTKFLIFSFQTLESLGHYRHGRECWFIAKRIYVEKTDTRKEIGFGDQTPAVEGSNTGD